MKMHSMQLHIIESVHLLLLSSNICVSGLQSMVYVKRNCTNKKVQLEVQNVSTVSESVLFILFFIVNFLSSWCTVSLAQHNSVAFYLLLSVNNRCIIENKLVGFGCNNVATNLFNVVTR